MHKKKNAFFTSRRPPATFRSKLNLQSSPSKRFSYELTLFLDTIDDNTEREKQKQVTIMFSVDYIDRYVIKSHNNGPIIEVSLRYLQKSQENDSNFKIGFKLIRKYTI